MRRQTTTLIFAFCLLAAIAYTSANNVGSSQNIVFASNTTNSTTKTNTTTNSTTNSTKTNSTTNSTSNTTNHTNGTNTTNSTTKTNTTNTTVAPSTYNKFCYACIFHNYTYCEALGTCVAANQTCSSGAMKNKSTGCPATKMCDYGASGYGYIGGNITKNLTGFNTTGSAAFYVPAGEPCVAAIVNANNTDLDVSILGSGIAAYSLTLTYPFDKNYTIVNSTLRLLPTYNVAYLYIGSISNATEIGGLVWSPHKTPVTPTNNNGSTKSGILS